MHESLPAQGPSLVSEGARGKGSRAPIKEAVWVTGETKKLAACHKKEAIHLFVSSKETPLSILISSW